MAQVAPFAAAVTPTAMAQTPSQIVPTAGPLPKARHPPSFSAAPPVPTPNPSPQESSWGSCRVHFQFGMQGIKNDKSVSDQDLRIPGCGGFTGEGKQQLADLEALLHVLEDDVERPSWSEAAFYRILRANISGSARALTRSCKTWHSIRAALFKAIATVSAVAAFYKEMRGVRVQPGENALIFVARAVRMFELFSAGLCPTASA
jgi:hypothetical protein